MARFVVRLTCLGLLCAVGVAHAGTGYVPLPGVSSVGSAGYEVQVSITNTAAQPRTVKQLQLGSDTDGTQRASQPADLQVPAGRTVVVKPAAAFRGLLELSGPADVRFSARLVGTGPQGALGVFLPVLTSDNLAAANKTVTLQDLIHGGTRTTDLTIVNLAKQSSQCTINLLRADGTAIASAVTIAVKPLSHRYFGNALGGFVGSGTVANVRATISCTREFYAYALLGDTATGEASFVGPAGSGESTLTVPGADPGCGVGATCVEARGVVFQPTPAVPVKRLTFNVPAGTLSRVKLTMDVTVGDWYGKDPDGKHLIYWFVINNNKDMPGMLYFRGPNAFTALVRHGIALRHADKLKIVAPFRAEVGRTYRCENDYDMRRGVYTLTITDLTTGQVAARLEGVPNVAQRMLAPSDKYLIDMGFPEGKIPDEVPSFGWTYSNVRIESYP